MSKDFIGSVLDERYEIQALLGVGGTALVFAAHDCVLGRQVAIKFVKPEYAWSSDVIDALVEEARIIAKLEHPNILSVYDQGTQTIKGQRLVYLVMQLAGGDSLKKRIDDAGVLSLNEAERIINQVCAALDYAHSHGVIHLDLKPANILFDQYDNVVVADFGFARLLRGMSRIKAKTGVGTPAYMPPEQLAGGDAGSFSDVYALGITLYHVLTNELPKREWTNEGLLVHLDHPLPPGVRFMIDKATQHTPSQRYRTARELAQAFTAAIAPYTLVPERQDAEADEAEPDLLPWEEPERDVAVSESPSSKKAWITRIGIGLAVLVVVASLVMFGAVQWRWERRAEATLAAISLILTASPTNATPTTTPSPSPMHTPSPNATPTPIPSPTYYLVVSADRLVVYAGPGEDYEEQGEVRRGDRLLLYGRLADGTWWQVDYLGRMGWIPAQPVGANVAPRVLPVVEPPPPPKRTRTPTPEPTPTPLGPNTVLRLENPGFEGIQESFIPAWQWWAEDNYRSPDDDPATSFDTPFFTQAPDPARMINGPTLQVEATAFVNFRVHVFQTVSAPPAVTVRFQVSARAFSNSGGINLAAGVDPDGGPDCSQARWGDELTIDQSWDAVQLFAPDVAVGQAGRVTVCLRAENVNPGRSNAVYFDNGALIANPE